MSDIREFPMGDGERLSLLLGPLDVIALHEARIADIERRKAAIEREQVERIRQALMVAGHVDK
jgi:hypothetical protein